MKITSFEILERFYKNHPDLVEKMKNADHNYSSTEINPYHSEGSVWTHTLMVYNYAIQQDFPIEVLFSTLLHDLGKPDCRTVRVKDDGKHYVSFNNHESLSYHLASDVLHETYSDVLTPFQIDQILWLVANHSLLFDWQVTPDGNKEKWLAKAVPSYKLYTLLVKQAVSDFAGRIFKAKNITVEEFKKALDVYDESVWDTTDEIKTSDKNIYITVGIPASGKSTWIDKMKTTANTIVISRDQVLMDEGESENYSENWANANQREIDKIVSRNFNNALKSGNDIIVDACCMSKKSRRKWVNPAKQKGYKVFAVVFSVGLNKALRRNQNRFNKVIGSHVIHNFSKQLYYPNYHEVDEIIQVREEN